MPTGPSDFFGDGFSPTPSDTTVFPNNAAAGQPRVTQGLLVVTAGNIAVRLASGTVIPTFAAPAAGTILPMRCDQVRAATTATLFCLLT